ncbi:hypothetical protein Pint_31702 [Pistacia integerrima]|uniref:Uncharacterized protein n=1 Tax=Pistacia integerrima TaxID=434235 RepID=A0ACC0XPD9_9ROSI|nr:hypothetical protein Pint_31702 [Pistacia integerrima]
MWGPANALLEENLSSDQQGLTPRIFERLFSRINEVRFKFFKIQLVEVLHDVECLKMEDEEKVKIEETVSASMVVEPSFPLQEKVSTEETEAKTEVRPA